MSFELKPVQGNVTELDADLEVPAQHTREEEIIPVVKEAIADIVNVLNEYLSVSCNGNLNPAAGETGDVINISINSLTPPAPIPVEPPVEPTPPVTPPEPTPEPLPTPAPEPAPVPVENPPIPSEPTPSPEPISAENPPVVNEEVSPVIESPPVTSEEGVTPTV
jgi:outer membrane biosynthesis protein TonB